MDLRDVFIDAFGRIREDVRRAITDQTEAALAYRPDEEANSIGWLVWHLTRVEDDHVSEIANVEQAYVAEGWADRFGLPPDVTDIGYGHTSQQVAAIRPAPDTLFAYHDSVHQRTLAYLDSLHASELDRIIDRRWDPPVTVGVRLVSVIDDCMQHAGQANFVRGLIERKAAKPQ